MIWGYHYFWKHPHRSVVFSVFHHWGRNSVNVQPACQAWGSPSTTLGNQIYEMCHWFTYQTRSSGVKNMFEFWSKTIRFYNFYHIFTVFLLISTVSSIDTFSQEKQNKTLAPTRDTLAGTNISPFLSPCLKAFLKGCSFSPSGISQFTGGYLPPCTFSDSACAASAMAVWSCSWGFNGWVVKGSLRKPKKHGVTVLFWDQKNLSFK